MLSVLTTYTKRDTRELWEVVDVCQLIVEMIS